MSLNIGIYIMRAVRHVLGVLADSFPRETSWDYLVSSTDISLHIQQLAAWPITIFRITDVFQLPLILPVNSPLITSPEQHTPTTVPNISPHTQQSPARHIRVIRLMEVN